MNFRDEVIVIGRLSRTNIVAFWLVCTVILGMAGPEIVQSVRAAVAVGDAMVALRGVGTGLFLAWLWFEASRMARRAIVHRGVGLYVRDGVLYDVLPRSSVRLADIRVAYRHAEGGFFRTALTVEVERSRPANPAYGRTIWPRTLSAGTILYRTPVSEILERLEACGVKVKGSKTSLIGT